MVLQLEPSQFKTISIEPLEEMNSAEFFAFCQQHRDLRIEREANGEITIMPPAGGETGNRNFDLAFLFGAWVYQDGTGKGFDSSTGFILPDGATRSPDIAWVTRDRLQMLSPVERRQFLPLAPDFVIELRSESDRLRPLREKMEQYINNGVQLGWLIDPVHRIVWIYQQGQEPVRLVDPLTVSGDPVLPGFTLELASIFDTDW